MATPSSPIYTVNSPLGSPPPIMLPPFQGPASPHSVSAILSAHSDIPLNVLQDMVASLVSVTAQCKCTYQAKLETYQDRNPMGFV